jgi:hypothetical protein
VDPPIGELIIRVAFPAMVIMTLPVRGENCRNLLAQCELSAVRRQISLNPKIMMGTEPNRNALCR